MLLSKQNSNKIGKLHTQTDMGCPFVLCYAQKSVNSKSYNNTKKSSLLLLAYLMLYVFEKMIKVFSLLTNVINNCTYINLLFNHPTFTAIKQQYVCISYIRSQPTW